MSDECHDEQAEVSSTSGRWRRLRSCGAVLSARFQRAVGAWRSSGCPVQYEWVPVIPSNSESFRPKADFFIYGIGRNLFTINGLENPGCETGSGAVRLSPSKSDQIKAVAGAWIENLPGERFKVF